MHLLIQRCPSSVCLLSGEGRRGQRASAGETLCHLYDEGGGREGEKEGRGEGGKEGGEGR